MRIVINLDVMMAKRKISSNELAEKIGITPANLSILKTGKAKAVRFSTLEKICEVLACQPGDILEYDPERPEAEEE
ncbi:MAG: helix-turn-helix transcriptional regulator [Lachnospiraceae bacterium]|nr:helix-turn-helix transcriptional regulator [Lachnospiraceae bacterium]